MPKDTKIKEISKCRACGRGLCKPKVFCTKNCKEHYESGFRVEVGYDNTFTVNDWVVVVPTPEYHKGEAYLG